MGAVASFAVVLVAYAEPLQARRGAVGPQLAHRPSMTARRQVVGPALALAFGVGCATAPTVLRAPESADPRPLAGPSLDPLVPTTLVAEWRSVRDRLAREDPLPAAPSETDGTRALDRTEWPVFARVYLALAGCDLHALATTDAARAELRAGATRALTEALDPRRIGWIHAHFGDPLTDPAATPSAVVHGAVLYAIERCGDALDDAALGRAGDALHVAFARAFAARADGVLPSYRGLVWVTDSLPALAAMALRARREGRADRPGWDRWRATVEASSLDATTGLLIAPLHAVSRRAMGPPRGSATMMAQPYLAVLDAPFAGAQWASAERHLLVTAGGLDGAREHPRGMERPPDMDSGRVVFGMGEAASGFAILAAASMGDDARAERLARSAWAVAGPRVSGDRVECRALPPVGHAVVLAGKTALLRRRAGR